MAEGPVSFNIDVNDLFRGRGANKRARAAETRSYIRQDALLKDQRAWDRDEIQRTVRGAREAGIHPLFALGGATGGSPAPTAPMARTGGGARGGVARVRASFGENAESKARARLDNARASQVENELRLSEEARLAQTSNTQQDTIKVDPEGVRNFPLFSSDFMGPPNPHISIGAGGVIRKRDPTVSTAQQNEDLHGEFAGEFYTLLNEWDAFKRKLDMKRRRTFNARRRKQKQSPYNQMEVSP